MPALRLVAHMVHELIQVDPKAKIDRRVPILVSFVLSTYLMALSFDLWSHMHSESRSIPNVMSSWEIATMCRV